MALSMSAAEATPASTMRKVEPDSTVIFDDYTVWRIAAYHKFSDRTRVYAGYANADPEDADDVDLFSVGLRHNF